MNPSQKASDAQQTQQPLFIEKPTIIKNDDPINKDSESNSDAVIEACKWALVPYPSDFSSIFRP